VIVYHGTTRRRAQRICENGFLPRKPSRRVWFASGHGYATGRAKTQARRAHDRPVVLTCDIDVQALKRQLGPKRVTHRNGIIAINAPLPVSVLRSNPFVDTPMTPSELAAWVNRVLGLKPHKGVGRKHPGIERLSRWVARRRENKPDSKIAPGELLHLANQWLPEYFSGVDVDPQRLTAYRTSASVSLTVDVPALAPDPREDEALACLADPRPKRRVRGLELLSELAEPSELFQWCVMHMDDESVDVRVAVLRTMLRCEDVDTDVMAPLAASDNKRIRAAAVAALAKHAGVEAPGWFERGLKDPAACVRLAAASQLGDLDPTEHHALFELALYDANPKVAKQAEKLIVGKGYARLRW
jgi:hypothetical protein